MAETALKRTAWQVHRFDAMATMVNDRVDNPEEAGVERYVGLQHLDPKSLKIRRWGSPSDVTATKLRFRKGDIIFGRRRVYQRKLAVADFDGICSAHAMVLRAKPGVALSEFLPFFMQSDPFMERAQEISVGSLSPTINWKTLAKQEFALPPLEEQRRITTALTSSRSVDDALASVEQRAHDLRRALRVALFSRGIRGEALGETPLGLRPSSWQVKPLGEVFELLDSQRVPVRESDRRERPGPYPYYGASGPIDHIDDFLFDEPTLLLAEDGMNLIDRSSPIVYRAVGRYWVNNHAHVLRPRAGIHIDFYYEYLEHISYLPYVSGTYQKKITRGDCESIPLAVPEPEEQGEIVKVFDQVGQMATAISHRLDSTKALATALLEKVLA